MKKLIIFVFLIFPFWSFAYKTSDDPLNGTCVAISPDHHWMALAESSNDQNISLDQIWLYNLKDLSKRLLLEPRFDGNFPELATTNIDKMLFSLDGQILYFETFNWMVGPGALHSIKLDGSNLRYITSSYKFSIISSGKYTGDLAVLQYRELIPAGGYEWYWAFTPEGKELGPMGANLSGVLEGDESVKSENDSESDGY